MQHHASITSTVTHIYVKLPANTPETLLVSAWLKALDKRLSGRFSVFRGVSENLLSEKVNRSHWYAPVFTSAFPLLKKKTNCVSAGNLQRDLILLPGFLGNRSPLLLWLCEQCLSVTLSHCAVDKPLCHQYTSRNYHCLVSHSQEDNTEQIIA